jgi:hypothetical protein
MGEEVGTKQCEKPGRSLRLSVGSLRHLTNTNFDPVCRTTLFGSSVEVAVYNPNICFSCFHSLFFTEISTTDSDCHQLN